MKIQFDDFIDGADHAHTIKLKKPTISDMKYRKDQNRWPAAKRQHKAKSKKSKRNDKRRNENNLNKITNVIDSVEQNKTKQKLA